MSEYRTQLNTYDEVIDQDGKPKGYWKSFFEVLDKIGLKELELRHQDIIEKLKENGVTYNVYEEENTTNRPWKLDPIPFLLHEDEWQKIEKSIIQRAHLLDLILKDIYGSQRLIKNGIIPPELVFDNAGYLLPCHENNPLRTPSLNLYACDMARGPDHQMWMLDNRCQSPSGAGYTLENRAVISQIFPEFGNKIIKKNLAPFFNFFQQSISTAGSISTDNPFTVFLTPGPGNETYFEHVYLATYLGYTLVQGSDLLVRDGYVWLKSIDRLSKIDVIIRRVDDEWCDPLELKEDSLLGVPGLLQVIRSGNVSVVNPIGSAVLENYGLMAFMENASKYLLDEPLLMPSVATWWCGQEKELNYVLEHLPRLVIKKANRKKGFTSKYCRTLSKQELDDLKELIKYSPKDYVAQEEVSLSTTPAYLDGKIVPRLAALRSYAIYDGRDYKVMQGGLTRSSPIQDKFVISNQLGGLSKDTWIISEQPELYNDSWGSQKYVFNEQAHSLPSRAAENLFWVGRLYERTLSLNNFISIVIERLNRTSRYKDQQSEYIYTILKAVTHLSNTYPGFTDEKLYTKEDPYHELFLLITDISKPGSITFDLRALTDTITVVSDKWNADTRRIIYLLRDSQSYIQKSSIQNRNKLNHSLEKLNIRLLAFYGNISSTFSRDHGYCLLESGINIERILALISVMRSCFSFKQADNIEHELIEVVLENHHLLAHYRNIFKSHLSLSSALHMILLDEQLPFTLSYLLHHLLQHINALPLNVESPGKGMAEKNVSDALALLRQVNIDQLILPDETTEYRPGLDKLLYKVYAMISTVTNHLTSQYFSHSVFHHSSLVASEKKEIDAI